MRTPVAVIVLAASAILGSATVAPSTAEAADRRSAEGGPRTYQDHSLGRASTTLGRPPALKQLANAISPGAR